MNKFTDLLHQAALAVQNADTGAAQRFLVLAKQLAPTPAIRKLIEQAEAHIVRADAVAAEYEIARALGQVELEVSCTASVEAVRPLATALYDSFSLTLTSDQLNMIAYALKEQGSRRMEQAIERPCNGAALRHEADAHFKLAAAVYGAKDGEVKGQL